MGLERREEQEMKIYASSQGTAIQSLLHEFQGAELESHIHEERCELIYLRQGIASLQIDGEEVSARSGALIVRGRAQRNLQRLGPKWKIGTVCAWFERDSAARSTCRTAFAGRQQSGGAA